MVTINTNNADSTKVKKTYRFSRISRGFTLIETLIAMAILAGGIVLITNSWGGNILRIRKSKATFEMVTLIERKMTELDMKYRDNVGSIPEEEEGQFEIDGKDLKDYYWKIESQPVEIPDLSVLLDSEENDQITVTVVDTLRKTLSESIKEVKLTVTAQFGKKKWKQSVVTYFVDFNKNISLSGLPNISPTPSSEDPPKDSSE